MTHYAHIFTIDRQVIPVHLGYYDDERAVPQDIAVDIRLYFAALPQCARLDKAPFIDYAILIHAMQHYTAGKSFALIEFMAHEFFQIVRDIMDKNCPNDDIKLWLRVVKVAPPIQNLTEGASFVVSDLPANATHVPAQ